MEETVRDLFFDVVWPLLWWFVFCFAMDRLLGKLGWKRRWMAWIPGLRYYALGDAIDLEAEGWICAFLDLAYFALSVAFPFAEEGSQAQIFIALAWISVEIVLYLLRIRLFLRLMTIFELKKRWIIPWLLADSLTLLVLAVSKKYQPKRELSFREDWEPGTAPAAIDGVEGRPHELQRSGLSLNLRKRTVRQFLKRRYLLKDIDLDIPNGSMVMLLGGSGAGKTTLVNAAIGYEQADATVLLNGVDVYQDYDQMKYRIGFVPQQNLIRGNDTVMHTVLDAAALRLPASVHGRERGEKVNAVLELLGLTAGAEGLVSKKSGGQLRRISIAMELVTDPELFVLDEPDSGLDGVIAREIFQKLRAIADEGKIVIVITHTPDRVVELFDKVIVLARDSGRVGRLAFYGSPQQAREFFDTDSMEGVVMRVNDKDSADAYIARFAQLAQQKEEVATA